MEPIDNVRHINYNVYKASRRDSRETSLELLQDMSRLWISAH